jgi:hypothetical protein
MRNVNVNGSGQECPLYTTQKCPGFSRIPGTLLSLEIVVAT